MLWFFIKVTYDYTNSLSVLKSILTVVSYLYVPGFLKVVHCLYSQHNTVFLKLGMFPPLGENVRMSLLKAVSFSQWMSYNSLSWNACQTSYHRTEKSDSQNVMLHPEYQMMEFRNPLILNFSLFLSLGVVIVVGHNGIWGMKSPRYKLQCIKK
jgi:hypothetical protein